MKRSLFPLMALAFLCSLASNSVAGTWYAYPGGVQASIDATSDGDSVVLVPGLYGDANLDFHGKAITVTSQAGPEFTVMSFSSSSPDIGNHFDGFIFHSGEGPSSVLSGITIDARVVCHTGGASTNIICDDSSPIIENMRLRYGTTLLYCFNGASPIIRNNEFTGNTYEGCWLGHWGLATGISSEGASPTIAGNTILDCGGLGGPGISCAGGAPLIEGNVIAANSGCGVMVESGDAVLRNNTILNNAYGGGVWCRGGNPVIDKCILAFNRGGGIVCEPGASPTVSGCDIYGNTEGTLDALCGIDAGNNFSADPLFCSGNYQLDVNSPCMPAFSPCGELVGALPAGCGVVVTMACPADMTIPAGSQISSITLIGFSITNAQAVPRTVRYAVTSPGLLRLHDHGDPASLAGTRILAPGARFIAPMPALDIPVLRSRCTQTIKYTVWVDEIPALFTSSTICVAEPPVPILITDFNAIATQEGIALSWSIVADEAVDGFHVYRSEASDENNHAVCDGLLSSDQTRYVDSGVVPGHSYAYTLVAVLSGNGEVASPRVVVTAKALELALLQNQPNPFNPTTQLSFTLPRAIRVRLAVYDVRGGLVATIVDESLPAGRHTRSWNGTDERGSRVGSGVYFYTLTAGKDTITRKMVLLK